MFVVVKTLENYHSKVLEDRLNHYITTLRRIRFFCSNTDFASPFLFLIIKLSFSSFRELVAIYPTKLKKRVSEGFLHIPGSK